MALRMLGSFTYKVPVRMRRFHLAWFRKMQGNCLRKDLGERIDLEQVDMEQSVLLGNPFDGLDLGHRGFGWDAQRPRR